MTIIVTNVGAAFQPNSGNVQINSVTIPAGSTILVGAWDIATIPTASFLSDTPGNTYINATSDAACAGGASAPFIRLMVCFNCKAISGGTIFYSDASGINDVALIVGYITGNAPIVDISSVLNSTGTAGTSNSITSGTPVAGGEMFFGLVGGQQSTGLGTFTQASGWSSTLAIPSTNVLAIGNILNAGTSTETYNPSWTASQQNGMIIASFIPGFVPFATINSEVAANSGAWAPQPYVFLGGTQPYAQRPLNPFLSAVPANNPPFVDSGNTPQQLAITLQASQPDPWIYAPPGGWQPYQRRTLNPQLSQQPVNNPPFNQRTLGGAPVITAWQPDPWVYNYLGPAGGTQPYGPHNLNPAISNVPANNPPFDIPNPSTLRVILDQWQPDPWPPVFDGNHQAYQGKQLSPGIPGQSVDNPPFIDPGRLNTEMAVVSQQQPDPWAYSYFGNLGPFMPKVLSPGIPGQSIDQPPYRSPGRLPQAMVPITDWQPETWPYVFMGWQQPYEKQNLNPSITAVPIQVNYRLTVRNVIVRYTPVKGPGWPGNTYPPANQG
jgi:hypothetical protein